MGAILAAALRQRPAMPWLLLVFGLLAMSRAGLLFLSDRLSARLGGRARGRLRLGALDQILRAGPAVLRQLHSAELTGHLVDRIEALDGLFRTWLPASLLAIAAPLLVLAVVLTFDPLAAAILGVAGLLVPLAMALSGIGAAAATRNQFQALTRLQMRFVDRVRGIATLVLGNQAEAEAVRLGRNAQDLRVRTMRVLRMAFLSSAALDCAAAAALVVLAIRYGAEIHTANPAGIGRDLFVLLLVPEFFQPLRVFSAAYQERMHAAGAAEALLALPPMPDHKAAAQPIRTVAARGITVAFDAVRFGWDPTRRLALDGVSFRVPAGETLVLAGPSGSGKSTVIEVLLGFVKPDSGRVLLNGSDLDSIVPDALQRLITWIGQRPVLFAGTIRDNIRFARPDATDDEVRDAVRAARVDSFADTLPDGLGTLIGEGGHGLSGGQAQRVAIARAFLKNAPLLLLDEPTSHLDPTTEREVLESLRRLGAGRTVIMATHSAQAQSFGDRRLELRDGRVMPARGVA